MNQAAPLPRLQIPNNAAKKPLATPFQHAAPVHSSHQPLPSRKVSESSLRAPTSSRKKGTSNRKQAQIAIPDTPAPHLGHKGPPLESDKPLVITASKVRVDHLPDWARENKAWLKVYLPTLYWTLFCSDDPFGAFAVTSTTTLVRSVQQSVDWAFPGSGWIVQNKKDPFYFLVSCICAFWCRLEAHAVCVSPRLVSRNDETALLVMQRTRWPSILGHSRPSLRPQPGSSGDVSSDAALCSSKTRFRLQAGLNQATPTTW